MECWDANIGVFLTNFTILLAEMRSEIVASLICVLVLHMKKLISGLVIPAIQFSFPSIPLSLVFLFATVYVLDFCSHLGLK